jgi:hypothetical protein
MICIQLGQQTIDNDGRDIHGAAVVFVPQALLSLDIANNIGQSCYIADPWAYGIVQVKEWISGKNDVCLSIMTMNILGHGLRQIIKIVSEHGGTVRVLCPPIDFFGKTGSKRNAAIRCIQVLEELGAQIRFLHCSHTQYNSPKAGSLDKSYYSLHVKYFHITSDAGDMVFATTCNANEITDAYVETAIIWKCESLIQQEQQFFKVHWDFAKNPGAITPGTNQLLPFIDSKTPYGALCSPLCTDNMIDTVNDYRGMVGNNAVAYAGKWAPHGAPKSPGDDWLIKFLRENGRFYFGSRQPRAAPSSEFDDAEYGPERICNRIFKIGNLHAKGIVGDNGFIQYSINMVGVGHEYLDVTTKSGATSRIGEIVRLDYLPSMQAGQRMGALLELLRKSHTKAQ